MLYPFPKKKGRNLIRILIDWGGFQCAKGSGFTDFFKSMLDFPVIRRGFNITSNLPGWLLVLYPGYPSTWIENLCEKYWKLMKHYIGSWKNSCIWTIKFYFPFGDGCKGCSVRLESIIVCFIVCFPPGRLMNSWGKDMTKFLLSK